MRNVKSKVNDYLIQQNKKVRKSWVIETQSDKFK